MATDALEDTLQAMAARGTAASTAAEAQPWCLSCGPDYPLTAVIAGHVCERCRRVSVTVESDGRAARWVQP